jgi:hypothetical protein
MGLWAPDLQASYLQQGGRLDYTAVVKQSDGQGVWNCEHITLWGVFTRLYSRTGIWLVG